jgi:hypothetical protein
MNYSDVLLDFWSAGLVVFMGYIVLPVAGFAATVRLVLNVYPGFSRVKK